MAREIPWGDSGINGTSLNISIDIVLQMSKHSGFYPHNARKIVLLNLSGEVLGICNPSPDVGHDINSRLKCANVESIHGYPIVPAV